MLDPVLQSLVELVRNNFWGIDAHAQLSPVREGLVATAREVVTKVIQKVQLNGCVGQARCLVF